MALSLGQPKRCIYIYIYMCVCLYMYTVYIHTHIYRYTSYKGKSSAPLLSLWLSVFSNLIASPCSCLPPPLFSFSVPGAPPRKLEVEAINSTAIRVTWKPPLQGKQHGQIRGYQVIFSRLENGEPRSQPNIMDVALPEAQVLDGVLSSLPLSFLSQSAVLFLLLSFYTAPFFHSILWAHTSFPPY